MSVILQSSGGGQITLQEPTTASNFTQTLPAATGDVMVSGNMPAFSASHSTGGDQTISSGTWTKINFETEEFDTNNNFASSRFTPTVAGYYQLSAGITGSGTNQVRIYKNGSAYKSLTTAGMATGSALVSMNGSTDYVEIYVNSTSTSIYTDPVNVYFQGSMVRTS